MVREVRSGNQREGKRRLDHRGRRRAVQGDVGEPLGLLVCTASVFSFLLTPIRAHEALRLNPHRPAYG